MLNSFLIPSQNKALFGAFAGIMALFFVGLAFLTVFFWQNVLGIFFLLPAFFLLGVSVYLIKQQKISFLLLFVFLLLMIVFIFALNAPGVDDAFISFRYAINLAEGKGLVYNAGSHVEGYSNFLWVLILSFLHKLGFSIPFVAKILGFVFLFLYYGLVYLFFKNSTPFAKDSQKLNLVFVACASFVGIVYYASTGMETVFYSFLLLAACLAFLRFMNNPKTTSGSLVFFLFLLVSLTRIEGIIFALISVFFLLMHQRSWWKCSLVLIVPYLVYTLFRFVYYGSLISQVFQSKGRPDFFLPWYYGAQYLFFFLLSTGLFFMLGLSVWFWFKKKKNIFNFFSCRQNVYLLSIIVLQTFIVLLSKGDWMSFFRLFIPVFAFWIIFLVSFIFACAKDKFRISLISLYVLIAFSAFSSSFSLAFLQVIGDTSQVRFDEVIGHYIKKHSNKDSVVITADAGIISYLNKDLRVYDLDNLICTRKELLETKKKLPPKSFFYVTYGSNSAFFKFPVPEFYWGENKFRVLFDTSIDNPYSHNMIYTFYENAN